LPVFPLYDEATLLLKVANGDEISFRQLFEHYWDNIYGVALAYTKSTVIAEEMVQDVFLKIWLNREKLAMVEKFDGYLFTVARNHIFNELRKKVKEEPFIDSLLNYFQETSGSPEKQLPPQQRIIYCLCRQDGLSQDEIATKLQISRHTVKSHMNKALKFIRNFLHLHFEIKNVLILYCILYVYL
jgi:DNA-directed RNA polymerase specialized sigma24 family protein